MSKRLRVISVAAVILLLLGVVSMYVWQNRRLDSHKVAEASLKARQANAAKELAALRKQGELSENQIKDLGKQVAEAKAEAAQVVIAPAATPDISTYYDSNFVALLPHGGLMDHPKAGENTLATGFEWTKQKNATIYTLEIRAIGDSEYGAQPADNTITYKTAAEAPEKIVLTKDMPAGDYQWRISAKKIVNAQEVVIQTTADRYYQIH